MILGGIDGGRKRTGVLGAIRAGVLGGNRGGVGTAAITGVDLCSMARDESLALARDLASARLSSAISFFMRLSSSNCRMLLLNDLSIVSVLA